jgi:hypothetical protein
LVADNLAKVARRRLQDRLLARADRHGIAVRHLYSTLEAALPAPRELVGGIAPDADAWQFVNRNRLIAALQATAQQRVPIAEGLHRALTVLWYFR